MAASTSIIVAKDGAGTTIAGGLVAQDKSGAGTGPFFAAQAIIDSQGVNVATVKAASIAPVATDLALVVGIHPSSVNPNVGNNADAVAAAATTAAPVVNYGYGFNGTTWDRLQVDGSKNLKVAGTFWQATQPVSLAPATSGGLTISSTLIASGTNATPVKVSAGQLYKIEVTNNSANIGYLKLYNTAGTPTAGSGTPVIRLMCPGNASGTGVLSTFDNGVAFGTGIGFTFTGGIADADTTSVAASAFIVNLYYK